MKGLFKMRGPSEEVDNIDVSKHKLSLLTG